MTLNLVMALVMLVGILAVLGTVGMLMKHESDRAHR